MELNSLLASLPRPVLLEAAHLVFRATRYRYLLNDLRASIEREAMKDPVAHATMKVLSSIERHEGKAIRDMDDEVVDFYVRTISEAVEGRTRVELPYDDLKADEKLRSLRATRK